MRFALTRRADPHDVLKDLGFRGKLQPDRLCNQIGDTDFASQHA